MYCEQDNVQMNLHVLVLHFDNSYILKCVNVCTKPIGMDLAEVMLCTNYQRINNNTVPASPTIRT